MLHHAYKNDMNFENVFYSLEKHAAFCSAHLKAQRALALSNHTDLRIESKAPILWRENIFSSTSCLSVILITLITAMLPDQFSLYNIETNYSHARDKIDSFHLIEIISISFVVQYIKTNVII